ncbi:hypothetical protein J2751_000831 [Halorubrum alkaliphilum]|uniref:DUF8053 domain-containing protein n=1 Tax=Halorubrum alkaliphilum TaxID=261290 RepID=A0A8T4GBN4_9EURY|nr:hypothetical protein [Halorubrum alkaliphilum]MBP1921834.1 hypothetical protein [Halorubrum alkaliphilum]
MSSLRKLVDCDGTPRVTLDKGELGVDGVLDEGEIPADQHMHVQRLSRGVYVVRAVDDDGIPELPEVVR